MADNAMVNEDGMNAEAYQQIISFLKRDKFTQFRGLASSLDRIKFIYKHEAYWPILQSIRKSTGANQCEKDWILSRQMREAGNSAFTAQDDETALDCYNRALLAAPADPWDGQGEDMALAFANRSALYLRQGRLQDCLADTRMALKSGYPKHLKYKVLQRQAKCYCDLGNIQKAINNYREALTFLNYSKIHKDQKNQLQNDIQDAVDALQLRETETGESGAGQAQARTAFPVRAAPTFPRNPHFPALHRGLTVKYSSSRGRHVVATEDIKCGAFLGLEEPSLALLWSDQLIKHCSACFTPVLSLVPCYTCSAVVFCCQECRALAWNTYHQFECKAMEGLTSAYQNIFLAYRAVSQRPLRFFMENKNKFELHDVHRAAGCYEYEYESDSDSGVTESDSEDESHELDMPYRAEDYENMYNLVTHSGQRSEVDHLTLATSACLLLYYLKINNYFGSSASRESDRELSERKEPLPSELLVGRLLYHMLEVTQYNSQDVCVVAGWDLEKGVKTEPIGSSVSPTIALINHSCGPNTCQANLGPATLLLATENIKKGKEVTLSYKVHFQDKPLSSRQSFLSERCLFECSCEACARKWPMYELLTKSVARPGVTAKALHHIKKMFLTISRMTASDLAAGYYDRVHTMWADYYNELAATLEKPNKGYLKLASRLEEALWLRWGSRGPACSANPPDTPNCSSQ